MRGSFSPVVAWCQQLFNFSGTLAGHLANRSDRQLLPAVLGIVRNILRSTSPTVAVWGCRILSRLGFDLNRQNMGPLCWKWFTFTGRAGSPDLEGEDRGAPPASSSSISGLRAVVECYRKHPALKNPLGMVIEQFGRGHHLALYARHLPLAMADAHPAEFVGFLHEILVGFVQDNRKSKDTFVREGVAAFVMETAQGCADAQEAAARLSAWQSGWGGAAGTGADGDTPGADLATLRIAAFGLLADAWISFAEYEEAMEGTMGAGGAFSKRSLGHLTKGARDANIRVQMSALATLFHLLDAFARQNSAHAPIMFKTLVFLQIENHEHTVIREFIVANMIRALDSMPAAPVGVMVDPLVKMTSLHGYANLDFDLFIALAKHPRLGLKQAIQLLDLLGIMCLNDPVFGRAASVPFLIVVNRLHAQRPLIEYIDRFSKVALSMFVHVETTLLQATRMSQYKTQALRKKAGKKKGDKAGGSDPTLLPLGLPSADLRQTAHVRRTLILETLAKVAHLQHAAVNRRLAMLLDAANKRYVRAKRSAGPGRVDSNKDGKADAEATEKEGHRGLQELRDFCSGMNDDGPEDGGDGLGGDGAMGGGAGEGLDRWGDPNAEGDPQAWGAALDGGRV